MNLKEIYTKNKIRRYNSIKKVKKENITLEINPIKKMKKDWIVLLAILVMIIGILLINFNLKYFAVSLILIVGLAVLFIFGNKAYFKCDKDSLFVKQGFQQLKLPYDKLKSVYIGRVRGFSYNIILRFEDNLSFLREFEFSLLCADAEDVNNFINNFELEENSEEKYIIYEKRKFWRRFIWSVFTIILFIILCIYFMKYSGINFSDLI